MSVPEVVVHQDEATLAAAVAARLVTALVDAQVSRGAAAVVLTGGGIGLAALAAVAASPARDAVDWQRVDVWWGDERFLPAGHPQRNETGARAALLDHVRVDPARVHPMGAADGPWQGDAEAAAAAYAAQLAAASAPEDHAAVPHVDVLLLGVGPDGHVASLFPEAPALHEQRTCVAVHGSPKPPPTRITLTLPAIRHAREVWLIAAGAAKASAIRLALAQDVGPMAVPAAGARGTRRTLALLDAAAASELPGDLRRPPSA